VTRRTVLEGGGFCVIFWRQGDRFAHQVGFGHRDNPQPFLISVEGGDRDLWPPSPPLQELHLEDRPGGVRVALLVGMAGDSHWSLSCSLDAAGRRLVFEAACRFRSNPERLGSRYRLADALYEVTPTTRRLAGPFGHCETTADNVEPAGGDQLEFFPSEVHTGLPATVQWRYELVR